MMSLLHHIKLGLALNTNPTKSISSIPPSPRLWCHWLTSNPPLPSLHMDILQPRKPSSKIHMAWYTGQSMPTQSPSLEPSLTTSLAMYLSIATSSNPNPTIPFGNTALQTNLVAYFKEYATSKALTLVFSYANNKCPNTNKQLTVGSVTTIVPKRMNRIALASPSVETKSHTAATKTPPPQHSSQPNSL